MKKVELVLTAGVLVGIIMLLMSLPLQSLFVSVLSLALSFLYFCLGLALFDGIRIQNIFTAESYKGFGSWLLGVAIGTAIAISQIIISSMFEILNYPMANNLIRDVLVFTSALLLMASIRNAKAKHRFYLNVIPRFTVFNIIAIIILLNPGHLFQTP